MRRSISIDYHKQESNKDKAKNVDRSINSYIQGNYNIFNISNRTNIMVSGKDCKEYVSFLMTCDNKTMDFGTTGNLSLESDGTIERYC